MSENKRLTPKQEKALQSLLEEPTTRAAALAAGVSEATVWRWLADEQFSAAYRDARTKHLESTIAALQAAGVDAVKALRQIANDATARDSARVSAAKAIVELGLRGREVLETEARIAELEAKLAAVQPGVRRVR